MMRDADLISAYSQRQSAVFKHGYDIVGDEVPENVISTVAEILSMCDNFDQSLQHLKKAYYVVMRLMKLIG